MTCLIGTVAATQIEHNATTTTDTSENIIATQTNYENTQNNIQINENKYNNYKNEKTNNKIESNNKNIKQALFNAELSITANPTNNLKVGDKVTITSKMDHSMATSDLTLYVNNKNITTFGRNSQTTYTLTQSGTNTIYALYPGDGGMLWDDIKSNTITLNVGNGQNTTQNTTNTNSTIKLTSNATKVNINESFSIYTQVTPTNATGTVSIYINNQAVGSYNVSSGGANIALPAAGEYDIFATYDGNNYYTNSTSNTITVTVIGDTPVINQTATIDITASSTQIEIGDSVTIRTPVTPDTATGNITLYCNGQPLNTYTTSQQGGTLTLTEPGNYTFYATYNGNNNYQPATSKNITIEAIDPNTQTNQSNTTNQTNTTNTTNNTKIDTQIIAEDMYMRVGSSIMMNFTLLDTNGQPIPNQELYITLDGKTEGPAITEKDGSIHLNFTNYDEESAMEQGNYPFTITYNGNDNYNPTNKTVTLTIAVRTWETTTTIKSNVTQINYGESFTITPTVEPEFMLHPIDNSSYEEQIELYVYKDGKSFANYTAHPREYWIFEGFQPGVYTFNATYKGSDILYPSNSNTITVTVIGDTPIVNETATIDITASSTQIEIGDSVTIRTPVTPDTATGNITLYCNGQPLNTYTTSQAGGTLTLTEPGNYTFYATYNGNNNYQPATSKNITIEAIDPNTQTNQSNTTNQTNTTNTTNNTKIDTQIIAEDMYMRVGSSIMMNFTLLDTNGQPIPNQELYITLDGKTEGPAITEKDGSIHLNFTNYDEESAMEQGNYPFTITYNGNDNYNPTNKTVTLTIAVRTWETTTTIKSNVTQINYGESFTITPTVEPEFMLHPIDNSSYEEQIELYVYKDGKSFANYTAHPREYWIFEGFQPGVYTFNATYKGSDILYPSNSNTITVTVIGDTPIVNETATIDITASSTQIEIGDSVTIRTPVTPDTATGNITLYCNGQPLNTYTTSQAGGTLTLTEPGNYTFYATYNGDSNYNATTSKNITIEVINSSVVENKLELDTYIGLDTIKPGLNFGVLITPTPNNFTGKINVSYIDPLGKKHTTTIDYPTSNGVRLNLTQTGNYTFYSYVTDNSIYGTVYSNNVTLEVKEDKKYELEIELWPDVAKFARSTFIITRQSLKDATGNITYVVDGEDFCTFTANELINNQPSFMFDKAGNISIQARYDGEDYGQVYSNKVIFEYLPLESIIEAEDITVRQGENAEISIRLIDEDGYIIRVDENDIPIGNQSVYIIVNNHTYGPFKTNSDGEARFLFNTSTLKIGNYPITIIYEGGVWQNLTIYDAEDGLYQDYGHKAANKTITLTVTGEKNTTIDAKDVTMEVYDQKQLNITVKDEDGQVNPTVTVKINNKEYPITIKDNVAYVDLSTLTEGKYVAYITYNPDETHKTSNKTVNIKVNKKEAKITLDNIPNNNVGDKINIKGKLTDSNNKTMANATIKIKIKNNDKTVDKEVTTTTNAKGEYNYNYTITKAGQYEVKVESIENTTHDNAKAESKFNSTKKNPTIQIKTDKNTYNVGDKIIIIPSLNNDATGKITLNINGQNITTDANKAYEYITTQQGSIKITASYPGDDKYNAATSNNLTVQVNKQTPTITINKIDKTPINTQVTITGILSNNNKSIANATVTVTVNNLNKTVKTNNNGIYTIQYTTNTLNTNNVSVKYNGDNKYNNAENKTTFNVYNNIANIQLQTDKNTYTVGESITITPTVTPKDATGKVTLNINGRTVQVDVNKSFKYMTDNATIITITAKYNGNNIYKQTSEVSKKVAVNKINTKLTIDETNNSKTNMTTIIKGKLTDNNNKTISNANITISINNNQTIQTKTDNTGVFQATYIPTEAKINNIKAVYNGDNKYNPSQNNITDNVTKLSTEIIVNPIIGTVGENITLVARVTDENGKLVNNGKVIFKLNGLTLKNNGIFGGSADTLTVKVVNGEAKYTLEAYLHLRKAQNLTATYIGSTIYEVSISPTQKAQIRLRNASVTVTTPKVGYQNRNITFTAKVSDITNNKTGIPKDNKDAYVFFKINGKTIRDDKGNTLKVKVVNGQAQLNYTLPNGMGGITSQNHSLYKQYTVVAGYVNPDYYPDARDNDTFTIERANLSFNVSNITFNNKTKKLSIKSDLLTDTNVYAKGQNTMIVKVNGATYKNSTTQKPVYYAIQDGKVDLTLDLSQNINKIDSVELVTGDRLVYMGTRLKTTEIKVIN